MLNDYITICKPRVVLLMLITAWVGMYLASSNISTNWPSVVFGTIGIACIASAAAVFNHLLDRELDKKMQRTSMRPVASNRISPRQALLFASILFVFATIMLVMWVNITTTVLTIITFLGYGFFYTLYLKHATPQNIVIGGIFGAMPPLLGWCSISGDINPYALLLVLIIFVWTPAHFWALAIYRVNDYKNANIPMLPVTHGINFSKFSILLYTILLCSVTCLPFVFGMSSAVYFKIAMILNCIFMYFALRLFICKNNEKRNAIQTFNYSIIYLFLLFATFIFDHKFGAQL